MFHANVFLKSILQFLRILLFWEKDLGVLQINNKINIRSNCLLKIFWILIYWILNSNQSFLHETEASFHPAVEKGSFLITWQERRSHMKNSPASFFCLFGLLEIQNVPIFVKKKSCLQTKELSYLQPWNYWVLSK